MAGSLHELSDVGSDRRGVSSRMVDSRWSCLLVHGPVSESVVYEEAKKHGTVLSLREDSATGPLRKGDARELVELLATPTIGDKPLAVVVGPLDEVSAATSDVLLKTVEEPFLYGPRLYLWARDLGEVVPTIKSRCLLQFAPGRDGRLDAYEDRASKVVSAYVQSNWTALVEAFREAKGEVDILLEAIVAVLSVRLMEDPLQAELLDLWVGLRQLRVLKDAPLTPARILTPFLRKVTG
jgi:hypothetical protein